VKLNVRRWFGVRLAGDISFGGDACLHMIALLATVRQFFPL